MIMAQILVNEISDNYTYSIVSSQFACVALPITAAWGPAYMPPESVYSTGTVEDPTDAMLEDTKWLKFESNQAGLESFVATFRGPSSNYKVAKDFSYQQALTLLSAGYDVLVCRVCNGAKADNYFDFGGGNQLKVTAKYPGTFGNNLKLVLTKTTVNADAGKYYWNIVVYISDPTTLNTVAAENITFVFGEDDTLLNVDEVKSNLIDLTVVGTITDASSLPATNTIVLGDTEHNGHKGTDSTNVIDGAVIELADNYYYIPSLIKESWSANTFYTISGTTATVVPDQTSYDTDWTNGTRVYTRTPNSTDKAKVVATYSVSLLKLRYLSTAKTTAGYSYGCGSLVMSDVLSGSQYHFTPTAYESSYSVFNTSTDLVKSEALAYMEWVYDASFLVIQLLKNKLDYNPNRLYVPWDDQNTLNVDNTLITDINSAAISALHRIIMDTAFYSRCATGMIDFPRSLVRGLIYNDSTDNAGYAQRLSHITEEFATIVDTNIQLYVTHSALFGPWAPYKLTGMSKQVAVPPSLLALLIHRAQLLNQATQYEWLLPDNRKHNLRIGEPDYKVPAKLRDSWQSIYGIGVNVIAAIPDLGINQWGNSTLFDVPPATYQALADLSTRWLVNAIEDDVYRTGISITFTYNNRNAYSAFVVGVTPKLDAMLNAGAIEDYKIQMSPDLDALGQVKARSVIGKIWIVPVSAINDITVDLIALPPGTDLSAFGS